MDSSTQKGFMAGCLASAGIFICIILFLVVMFVVMVRGCSQAVSQSGGAAAEQAVAALGGGQERPKDEKPFKKVWLSGSRSAKAAHVLRIDIHGIIADMVRQNIFDTGEDKSAPTALLKIRAATKDKTIRGLYLDIDSPGGGVTMADELHDAIVRFRASDTNRFVFVHMGDMCCSGGYYVAAPASWIMARPTTLTGSIGVIMSSVNAAELTRKIGVEGVTIASGANKDLLNPLKPVNPEHVKILERPIRQLHDRFVGIVAAGRRLRQEDVRAIADGRVLSAKDALAAKLVDGIGHAEDARRQLAKMAGGDVRIYGYRSRPNFTSLFADSLLFESAGGAMRRVKAALDEETTPRAEYRLR